MSLSEGVVFFAMFAHFFLRFLDEEEIRQLDDWTEERRPPGPE